MEIKTKIGIAALVTSGAALLIGAVVVLAFTKIKELEHQSEDHRVLLHGMSELDLLTHEYFIENDTLARARWRLKHAMLSKTFSAMSKHDHASSGELAPMRLKLEELVKLFAQSVGIQEQITDARTDSGAGEEDFEKKLMNDILRVSQSLADDSAIVEARVWRDLTEYIRRVQALVLGMIGGLVVLLALSTLAFGRSITGPMNRLRKGTEIIGSGNLEYRVEARQGDEFGALGKSFNAMTERLKTVLASRDDLEREVQARRQAEDGIRLLNAELEQRVQERTLQLELANSELKAFTYSVSHDLRAPLRAIEGFAQILSEENAVQLDEAGRHSLQRVSAGVQRMTQIVDDLLRLSQISRAQLQPRDVDLSALVEAIAGELSAASPERTVSWVIAPGIVSNADAGLVRIALENLLRNAWKYTGKHPAARIEFGVEKRGRETVHFVRDDGAGFDMAYAGKLFGAFQRLHDSRVFEGSGIGLAIVQRIVHRHGGRIWAESAVEQGATFFFTLPGSTAAPTIS